jgi:hypothetical protein
MRESRSTGFRGSGSGKGNDWRLVNEKDVTVSVIRDRKS